MTTLNSITPLTSIARPLFGLSLTAISLIVFKPVLSSFVDAGARAFNPSAAAPAGVTQERLRDTVYLNRLAKQYDADQPTLAAELRSLACMDCAND